MYMSSLTLEELGRIAEQENNELAVRIFVAADTEIRKQGIAVDYWESYYGRLMESLGDLRAQCESLKEEVGDKQDYIDELRAQVDELTYRLEGLEK